MHVLVTGVGGFVGSRLARHLAARGAAVSGTYFEAAPTTLAGAGGVEGSGGVDRIGGVGGSGGGAGAGGVGGVEGVGGVRVYEANLLDRRTMARVVREADPDAV